MLACGACRSESSAGSPCRTRYVRQSQGGSSSRGYPTLITHETPARARPAPLLVPLPAPTAARQETHPTRMRQSTRPRWARRPQTAAGAPRRAPLAAWRHASRGAPAPPRACAHGAAPARPEEARMLWDVRRVTHAFDAQQAAAQPAAAPTALASGWGGASGTQRHPRGAAHPSGGFGVARS